MKRKISRRRQVVTILLASATLMAPFLFYVWGQVEIVRTSYDMEELTERAHHLEQTNRALRLERARLLAAPRVEATARELGLAPLTLDRMVVVRAPDRPPLAAPKPPTERR